jgi:Arc/MetJ family transcription regulator
MKTTIDIPKKLLNSVAKYSKARTKREAVLTAMQEYAHRRRLGELAPRLGQSETFMSSEQLLALRKAEMKE